MSTITCVTENMSQAFIQMLKTKGVNIYNNPQEPYLNVFNDLEVINTSGSKRRSTRGNSNLINSYSNNIVHKIKEKIKLQIFPLFVPMNLIEKSDGTDKHATMLSFTCDTTRSVYRLEFFDSNGNYEELRTDPYFENSVKNINAILKNVLEQLQAIYEDKTVILTIVRDNYDYKLNRFGGHCDALALYWTYFRSMGYGINQINNEILGKEMEYGRIKEINNFIKTKKFGNLKILKREYEITLVKKKKLIFS